MFSIVSLWGRYIADRGARLSSALHFSTAGNQLHKDSTLDREEVDKFKSMSSDWWNPYGVCQPLHSMNTLRIPLIRDGLLQSGVGSPDHQDTAKPLTGLNILDVGCGAGIISEQLARIGASVVGIDACRENIEAAKEHAVLDPGLEWKLEYYCQTIEEHLDSREEMYDAVVASEVIEHVDNQEVFLSKCTQVLKPGGSMFVTTLNRSTRSWIFAIIGAEYVLGLLPRGTHQWEKFVKPEELRGMLEAEKCQIRCIHGMMYVPWANVWSWVPDCSINYALHAVKIKQ